MLRLPKVEITLRHPRKISLAIPDKKIRKHAGSQLTKLIKARLRQGLDGDGGPLPAPKDGGRAGRKSGRLIREIRLDARTGIVAPTWRRTRSDVGSVRTSFGLLRALMAKDWRDPMGSQNRNQQKKIAGWAEETLTKNQDKLLTAKGQRTRKLKT